MIIINKQLYFKYRIQCIVQFYPLYKYPLFKNKGFGNAYCPKTEKFFNNMISFPFHIWMTQKNFNYMITMLSELETLIFSAKLEFNAERLKLFNLEVLYSLADNEEQEAINNLIYLYLIHEINDKQIESSEPQILINWKLQHSMEK